MLPTEQAAELLCRLHARDRGPEELFLPQWTVADWRLLLQAAQPVLLAPQDVLVRHGHADSSLYLLVRGELEVYAGGSMATLGQVRRALPGAVIGEIAFFDGGPRSATVWAVQESELFVLQRTAVEAFAAQHAQRALELLFALGRVLAARARRFEQRRHDDLL